MNTYRLAWITLAATLTMMIAGGLVHSTGSALACPDWPLCYGQAFPEMTGGVLYEHSHRLIGVALGLLTLALSMMLILRWRDRPRIFGIVAWSIGLFQGALMGRLGVVASGDKEASPAMLLVITFVLGVGVIALAAWAARKAGNWLPAIGLIIGEIVLFQATLGGVTVLLRLPLAISSAHLATAMVVVGLLVFLIFRLGVEQRGAEVQPPIISRRNVAIAIGALYFQILLGAAVRHTGSALACNVDLFLCDGNLLPQTGPGFLLISHRWMGMVAAALIIWSSIGPLRAAKAAGLRLPRILGRAAHGLITVQIILGFLTVTTFVSTHVATTHLTVAALLLATQVAFFLTLRPLGEAAQMPAAARASSTPHETPGVPTAARATGIASSS